MSVELTEDQLYDLSDEELEAAFNDAKAGTAEVEEVGNDDVENEVEENEEEIETEVESEEEDIDEEIEDEVAEEDDENLDDDTEQPGDDEDSDENNQDEEDDAEEEEEPADDPDEDEVDTQDADEEESEPEPEVKRRKYKANGQEFEFTEEEVLEEFGKVFGQAANYTQKMQAMAEDRKTISAIKDNNMSHDDINMMIDVFKGDKDAITSMLKKHSIDAMDLDVEQEQVYTPKEYGRSEQELAIDDVISVIQNDQEFATTQNVVDRQWDAKSRQALAENPQMIQGLHNDVKSGVYDAVSNMATKLKVLDGGSKSDLEYYIEAGSNYYAQLDTQKSIEAAREEARAEAKVVEAERLKAEQEKVAAVKQKKAANKVVKKAATKRKAAAPTKKAAGKNNVIDYLDDSDEAFEEWYKKLQDNM